MKTLLPLAWALLRGRGGRFWAIGDSGRAFFAAARTGSWPAGLGDLGLDARAERLAQHRARTQEAGEATMRFCGIGVVAIDRVCRAVHGAALDFPG